MSWEPNFGEMKKYDGIAGWLAFFAFILFTTPLRILSSIISNYVPFINSNTWIEIKTPGSELYNP